MLQRRVYARVLSSPSFQHIIIFYFFMQKKQQQLAKAEKIFSFFLFASLCMKHKKTNIRTRCSLDISQKSPKRKAEQKEWMRKNEVHLFFEQRLSVTSEINCERDTIFHEQNAVVFCGDLFSVGVVFNRHHAFVERTKFRIQSRANESRN